MSEVANPSANGVEAHYGQTLRLQASFRGIHSRCNLEPLPIMCAPVSGRGGKTQHRAQDEDDWPLVDKCVSGPMPDCMLRVFTSFVLTSLCLTELTRLMQIVSVGFRRIVTVINTAEGLERRSSRGD